RLPDGVKRNLLTELEPADAAALLNRLDAAERERCLGLLAERSANELRALLQYPPDSAGRLMNPHIIPFRADMTARQALNRLRALKPRPINELLISDAAGRLSGRR